MRISLEKIILIVFIIYIIYIIYILIRISPCNIENFPYHIYPDEIKSSCTEPDECCLEDDECYICDGGIYNRRW